MNGGCCGEERPGMLSEMLKWKHAPTKDPPELDTSKLLVISFREPVERTISHFYQNLYCKNMKRRSQGAMSCRRSAKLGISTFLENCPFGNNWQTKYVDGRYDVLNEFDFIVLGSERMDESMVLMSISKRIPVMDLIPSFEKVVSSSFSLAATNSSQSSCADQWMKKMIPKETLDSLNVTCTSSCVGKIGRLAFTDKELDAVRQSNAKDLKLWNDYVIPMYNRKKEKLMQEFGKSQSDLDATVALFKSARKRKANKKIAKAIKSVPIILKGNRTRRPV